MNKKITILAVVAIVIFASALLFQDEPKQVLGSVNLANEYQSTTTSPLSYTYDGLELMVKATSTGGVADSTGGRGILGSITVHGTGGGFIVYNATTSDVTKRELATTSLQILAALPNNSTAGTYVYDLVATKGMLIDFNSAGGIGTTTFTFR